MKTLISILFIFCFHQAMAAPANFTGDIVYFGTKMSTDRVPTEYSYLQISGINPTDSKVSECYSSDRGNGALPIFYVHKEEDKLYSILLAAFIGQKKNTNHYRQRQ